MKDELRNIMNRIRQETAANRSYDNKTHQNSRIHHFRNNSQALDAVETYKEYLNSKPYGLVKL